MSNTLKNAVNWFEIPVRDLDRSVLFYEAILGRKLTRSEFDGQSHAVFPAEKDAVTGSLVGPTNMIEMTPGKSGTVIYLDCTDLGMAVERAGKHGGGVVLAPTPIGPHGTIAIVSDPDGNRIGLHTPPKA